MNKSSNNHKIKTIIADDHILFADGIESILELELDIEVVGKSQTGAGVFELVKEKEIDLVLLDVNLMDMSGIEVAKQLSGERPEIRILAISMYNEESFVTQILKQGASGYILKNTDKDELLKAIRTVYNGETFFSKEVTETIMRGLLKSQNKTNQKTVGLPKISRREKEVLALIAQEFTTQEIADKLFITLKTVESHRGSLLAKFGVRNSVGLVKLAVEKGLV